MKSTTFRMGLAALLAAGALALAGCGNGSTGAAGPQGPTGPTGPAGPQGPAGPAGSDVVQIWSNATPATDAQAAIWVALKPKIEVTSVAINGAPVVDFKVTDTVTGEPIVGLGNTYMRSTDTVATLQNLQFAIAKLVPGTNGAPSRWVSYLVTTTPTTTADAAPTRPGSDASGTLVDHGDGTYTYTFYRDITQIKDQIDAMTVSGSNNKADLDDLTYEQNLVHRLAIQISGNAPGTGNNTPDRTEIAGYSGVTMTYPYNAIYDFVPATGAVSSSGRDIVSADKCNECHRKLGGFAGDDPESSAAGFHGGSRNDSRFCVVCHTSQRRYGRTGESRPATGSVDITTSSTYILDDRTVGAFPNYIHKLHAGELLALQGYNYARVLFNETLYPQDIRNCTKCHDGSATSTARTAQGDNWKNVPSRLACGSCHDGIDFATGMGVTLVDAHAGLTSTTSFSGFAHGGFAQPDDSQCTTCHTPGEIDVVHLPVTPPNTQSALHVVGGSAYTNAAWIASNTSRLPEGAIKVDFDIKSVSRDNATGNPVMVFRWLQNGQRADLNDPATAAVNPATGAPEMWDGFMGAPSAYFVFAVPQDGIATPSDFNASASGWLRSIWDGTATGSGAGTLTGPDSDGYYTVTLTGVTIPANAVMLTGGMGFTYTVTSTLPLTQTNLPNYPVSPSPVGAANPIGGLMVIQPNATKVATGYTARRPIVDDAKCNLCHQELGTFTVDAFHAGQRNDGTTCAWCHNPNRASSAGGWSADSSYFVHAIHAGAKRTVPFTWHATAIGESFADVKFPGILRECETCHIRETYNFAAAASQSQLPNRLYRTDVTGDFNPAPGSLQEYQQAPYFVAGSYGSGFSFNAGTGVTTEAAATTLVTSPITTACFACHDTSLAMAHMEVNGGSIYQPRGGALGVTETCMVCHDAGRIADIKVVHAK
jgi:OmcA/MtrC family decaheme c-type cytochrome